MTTVLAYHRQGEIDYARLDYDPDEPGPLPDAMFQFPILQEFLSILGDRFTASGRHPDNFLSSNTILCYDPANLNRRVQPDCYLAFGVAVRAILERKLYLPWEVGKPPDFVLEVGSESTRLRDITGKRRTYAQMGVPEYWRFDPTGGDYYGEPLVGERLVDGEYQPFPLTTEPDGALKGYSPTLDLHLCWYEGKPYIYDPAAGEYLKNLTDTQAALRMEQVARHMEQAARQDAEAALRAAQARIRQLEEELRRRP